MYVIICMQVFLRVYIRVLHVHVCVCECVCVCLIVKARYSHVFSSTALCLIFETACPQSPDCLDWLVSEHWESVCLYTVPTWCDVAQIHTTGISFYVVLGTEDRELRFSCFVVRQPKFDPQVLVVGGMTLLL